MSLYDDVVDDIGLNEKQSDIANWGSNSFKLLEAQLQAKKLSSNSITNQLKREKITTTIAPVIDLSERRKRKENEYLLANTNITKSSLQTLNSITSLITSNIGEIKSSDSLKLSDSQVEQGDEEYNPLKPNDYDKLVEDLKKKKLYTSPHENEHSKSNRSPNDRRNDNYNRSRSDHNRRHLSPRHSNRHRSHRDSQMRSRYDNHSDDDEHRNERNESKRVSGATFAPPPSLIEEDKKAKNEETNENNRKSELTSTTKSLFSKSGLSMAEKMMEKMGYKEGEGLGRNKQGMSIALQVEKTGKRSGRIIHENDMTKESANKEPNVIQNDLMKNPSKVILLKNMVGPGEVDAELEGETKEECQKYGEVNKVVIFEIPDAPANEAVRIFIEFKTLPSAIKALVDLNGRFFGGRVVRATFYNLDKFRQYILSDDA